MTAAFSAPLNDSYEGDLAFNWNDLPPEAGLPYGNAGMRIKDRAYGDYREYLWAGGMSTSEMTGSGRINLGVDPGGKSLTGIYTVRPDTAELPFTATCVAGECLGNTASPEEIEGRGTTNPTPTPSVPVAPKTGKIKGAGVVKKGATPRYKFRALRGDKATFECKLDRAAWRRCASPYAMRTAAMTPGRHVLKVRAIVEEERDKTPSRKVVRIVRVG